MRLALLGEPDDNRSREAKGEHDISAADSVGIERAMLVAEAAVTLAFGVLCVESSFFHTAQCECERSHSFIHSLTRHNLRVGGADELEAVMQENAELKKRILAAESGTGADVPSRDTAAGVPILCKESTSRRVE